MAQSNQVSQSAEQKGADGARLLQPVEAVERAIAGGETHTYNIRLDARQFVHIVVDPQGIDVALTLYGPGGEKLLVADLLKYPGPEPLSFVASKEGAYRLKVKAVGTGAVSGRYMLKSETKSKASETDRERMAAEAVLREAVAQEDEVSKESLGRAVEKYGEAIRQWRALGDKYWEAFALNSSGRVSYSL
ncbi:MAG: hypothetical protein M3362_13720, partial [Acidobacteriota bacterium]|nr:hypothetical protein [Acidobacteriota bacterium]